MDEPPTADGADDARGSWPAFELELLRHDPREWLVVTGDRTLVAVAGVAVLTASLAGLVAVGVAPLADESPVLFVLFALVAANFTLIAIVTSFSQFLLTRRLESPGEIRRKMDDAIDYREAVGETLDRRVTPVEPGAFFLALFRHARTELDGLAARSPPDETLRALVADLDDHCAYVVDVLRRPSSGPNHALFVSLSADYERAVYRVWRLRLERGDAFDPETAAALDRLATTLQHIEVAGRLFRTVFIEAEVSALSRRLLYVGLPAQVAGVALMLTYSAPGVPFSPPVLRALVVAVVAAGFAPFVLLGSYVVRLTVVARRTADTFPFSSRLSSSVGREEV